MLRKVAQADQKTRRAQGCASARLVPMFVHMPRNLPLIGSAQAAKVFGVDRATFNRWVAAGRIPIAYDPENDTGARLFDADVIDVLADQHKRETRGGAA